MYFVPFKVDLDFFIFCCQIIFRARVNSRCNLTFYIPFVGCCIFLQFLEIHFLTFHTEAFVAGKKRM